MRRLFATLGLMVAFGASAPTAQAGVYTDDLSKCLVKSATPADQQALLLWIFSVMSAHPSVKSYTKISPAQQDVFNKQTGALMQRLLTEDCRAETIASMKYEGASAIGSAFNLFGQMAMRGLMSDPDVTREISGIMSGVDTAKIEALGREAGVPTPPSAKP